MNTGTLRFRTVLGLLPLAVLGASAAFGWRYFLAGGFRSIVAWLALMLLVPALALVVTIGTLWRTARTQRNPGRLVATVVLALFCLWPLAWQFGVLGVAFPFDLGTTTPTASIRLPTDAPMRVLWGGDDIEHNHHAMFPDQRWAYDLGVEPVLVGSKRLEDYGCWDVPVVAPTSAIVHVAHDGEPDHVPGMPGDLRAPFGNHVVLELGERSFLVIAHLRKGSVRVREGQRVSEGALIGACGNSGNTSEPHVHIHAQRQDPRGRPINFAEGLPLFFRDHDGPAMPLGGVEMRGLRGRIVATGEVVRHVRARTASNATAARTEPDE